MMPKKKQNDNLDDNDLIIKCILGIRTGLLNESLGEILRFYNELTGEKLELKKKTKLEIIRDGIANTTNKAEKAVDTKEEAEGSNEIVQTQISGNELVEKINIITNEFDQEEFDKNKKMSSKVLKNKVKRDTQAILRDTSDTDRDVRFRNTNRAPDR